MAAPPLEAGAVQLTVAWALPAVVVTFVGAPGVVAGVTAFEAADGWPVPAALVAGTVKVEPVPLVRPITGALVGVAAAGGGQPPRGVGVVVSLFCGPPVA